MPRDLASLNLSSAWKKAKRSLSLSQKTRERWGRGTMSSKRNNSQLDRSYKKARGIKDDARGPKVDPTTILNIAFMKSIPILRRVVANHKLMTANAFKRIMAVSILHR